ncbi:MAG: hypothetical protein AAGH99_14445 [Planctomycetota bacterium]
MRYFTLLFVVSVLATFSLADPPTIAPETTYYVAPVDAEGYVDYVVALNAEFGKPRIASRDNAFVGILDQTFPLYPDADHVAKLYNALNKKQPTSRPRFTRFLDYAEARGLPMAPPIDWSMVPFGTEPASPTSEPEPPTSELESPASETAEAMEERAYGPPWTAEELPEVARWIDSIEESLDAIIAATARPDYYAPLVRPHEHALLLEVLLPQLSIHRTIGRSLNMRARRHLGEGNLDAAINDWAAIRRLGRLQTREPTVIANLVGISLHTFSHDLFNLILSQPEITQKQIQELNRTLDDLPAAVPMARVIQKYERAMFLDLLTQASRGRTNLLETIGMMQSVSRRTDPMTYMVSDRTDDPLTKLISDSLFDLNRALRRVNISWDGWFGKIPDDYKESSVLFDRIEAEAQQLADTGRKQALPLLVLGKSGIQEDADIDQITDQTTDLLLGIFSPALSGTIHTEWQSEVKAALEPVALALAQYRLDQGKYPPLLQSLIPDYLEELPDDLFGNRSLRYRRDGQGYRLYSIGSNLVDDGGVHDFENGDIVLQIPWSLTE